MFNTTYLIIPDVIASDSNLNFFDRLLYGKIYSLSKQQGYCWASNTYLANYFGVTTVYVSNAISRLVENNYLNLQFDNTKPNDKKRIITINYNALEKSENVCDKDDNYKL